MNWDFDAIDRLFTRISWFIAFVAVIWLVSQYLALQQCGV